jgi:hypothetical protein
MSLFSPNRTTPRTRPRHKPRPRLDAPEDRLLLNAVLMSKTIRRFVMAVAFGFLAAGAAHADPVLEFTSTGTLSASDSSLGFSFTTNRAISVVALDAYAVNASGNQVRLYDATGTTLASATVLPTDPTEGFPTPFFSHAITPLSLAAGRTYYVAEDYFSSDPDRLTFVTFTKIDPSIAYGAGVFAFGLGRNPTSSALPPFIRNGFFGPNFDVASVPEPSSLVTGLTGMAFGLCCRFLRRARQAHRTGC